MNDTMAAAIFQEYARFNATINQNGWKTTLSRGSKRAWIAGVLIALAARLAPSMTDLGRTEVSGTRTPTHA